jgi:hypothetical protein
MPTSANKALLAMHMLLFFKAAEGQHYCWPCAENEPVIGKDTHASQTPEQCYSFFFKYFNNLANSTTTGYRTGYAPQMKQDVVEADDMPPNVLAIETNECGTTIGNFGENISSGIYVCARACVCVCVCFIHRVCCAIHTGDELHVAGWLHTLMLCLVLSFFLMLLPIAAGMTPEQQELVQKKQRLAVGEMHQCPCARQGRLHIIKGSVDPALQNYSKVEALWGKPYTDAAQAAHDAMEHKIEYVSSTEEYSATLHHEIFGMHSVFCGFHKSGPCTLQEVEDGVTRSWNRDGDGKSHNFSAGYVPLMDNNLMLWTESIGPLLDVRSFLHFVNSSVRLDSSVCHATKYLETNSAYVLLDDFSFSFSLFLSLSLSLSSLFLSLVRYGKIAVLFKLIRALLMTSRDEGILGRRHTVLPHGMAEHD